MRIDVYFRKLSWQSFNVLFSAFKIVTWMTQLILQFNRHSTLTVRKLAIKIVSYTQKKS